MIYKAYNRYGKRPYNFYIIAGGIWSYMDLIILLVAIPAFFYYQGGFFPENEGIDYSLLKDSDGLPQSEMYYPNIHYKSKNISYDMSVYCSPEIKASFSEAISFIDKNTILDLYPSRNNQNPNIKIVCKTNPEIDSSTIAETYIYYLKIHKNYLEIPYSEIYFYEKEEECPPNVAIHELLHTLAFDHNKNINNILYPILSCENQKIDKDNYLFKRIDEIYRGVV